MLTVKQFRGISVVVVVLAVILAIASLSMARFMEGTNSSSATLKVGAFHMCIDGSGGGLPIELCSTIDKDCSADFNILGQQVPFTRLADGCDKFNLFRGMHVTATLFICIAAILGGIYLCVNPLASPKLSLGMDITYCVLTGVASVFYVISLITCSQAMDKLQDNYSNGTSIDKWQSFWLTAAAIGFSMLALIIWLVGRFMGKPSSATGLENMPLTDGNGSYVPPAAPGQQQYFNYGAPAPQPNYQQYGGAPTANYGYGYQPPAQ